MICVLLADDQALVRAGVRMILKTESEIEVVGEAGDGAEAVALAREVAPDVVLMDLRMPVMDGIEATRQIVDGDDTPRVLVLTTFDLDEYVYEALRAGASGFLLKDAPESQLIAGIRIVADGDSLFAPAVTRRLIERFAGSRPSPPPPGLQELTPRESRCFASSRAGCQTPRSLRPSSSASTRSRRTPRTSSASSISATAFRRSCSPMRRASFGRVKARRPPPGVGGASPR